MNNVILIGSHGMIACGFCVKSGFVSETVIAVFVCHSFFYYVWVLQFPFTPMYWWFNFSSFIFTMDVDQFNMTQNGRNVCNFKVVHNHELTWINLLWSTTMYASTKLSAKLSPGIRSPPSLKIWATYITALLQNLPQVMLVL